MNETTEFLEQLWAGKPDDLYLLIWTLAGKRSAWFQDTDCAARYVADRPGETEGAIGDVYVGVGLSSSDRGEHKRCPANEIAGITGMWADVDYEDGAAHRSIGKKLPLPPTGADARKIIEAVGLQPTIIVHSGHGLQAWWLLKEPLNFDNEVERKAAAAMSRLWQKNIQKRAELMGWSVDSVPDLARILRVPGTQNRKIPGSPVPVKLIEADGPRYVELSDFEEVLPESFVDITSSEDSRGSARGWEYWKETIGGVSEGERDNRMTSFAGKLFSIISDIDDQEGSKLLLYFMLLIDEKNKPPMGEQAVRKCWISIWRKEKSRRAGLEAAEMFDDENEEALSEEGAIDKKMQIIRNRLGNLPIKEITKRGKQNSEYMFELDDGTSISVGSILNQAAVRKAILDATSGDDAIIVPRRKMEIWDRLCGSIATLAVEIEMPDAERKERVSEWLQSYIASSAILPEDRWQGALNDGSPFQRNGWIYINVNHFYRQVRFDISIKDEGYLRSGLVDLGFKHHKAQAWIENEKGVKKNKALNYWRCEYSDLVLTPNRITPYKDEKNIENSF